MAHAVLSRACDPQRQIGYEVYKELKDKCQSVFLMMSKCCLGQNNYNLNGAKVSDVNQQL